MPPAPRKQRLPATAAAAVARRHGSLAGAGRRIALVVARFHEAITRALLAGALDCLRRQDVTAADQLVVWVPGAFELPIAALHLAQSGRFDAVVCLGCVIRGATPHFDYVCAGAATGIGRVALDTGVPVIFGVLTCDTEAQAWERVASDGGHKGAEAASAALEMASLAAQLARPRRARTAAAVSRRGSRA